MQVSRATRETSRYEPFLSRAALSFEPFDRLQSLEEQVFFFFFFSLVHGVLALDARNHVDD